MTKPTINLVTAWMEEPMATCGFRRRKVGIFTREVEEEKLAWVGLNYASEGRGDSLIVNPIIGMRDQEVERLVAELTGSRFHPYIPPTITTSLSLLMPGPPRQWLFSLDSDHRLPATSISEGVATHGMTFVRGCISLDGLRAAMEQRMGHGWEYRVPIVLSLLGNTRSARKFIRGCEASMSDRTDPAAENYRRFANTFRQYVRKGPTPSV